MTTEGVKIARKKEKGTFCETRESTENSCGDAEHSYHPAGQIAMAANGFKG